MIRTPNAPWISGFGSLGYVAATKDPCEFTDFARHYEDRIAPPDEWIHNVTLNFLAMPQICPQVPPEHGILSRTPSHDFAGL